ncbi:MAG: dienelactone hydrolase family protein [Lentisphaerae bacterium]|nr:dienelactone hydrolase family protein [Lentisphaerota bacterium]
MRWLLGIGGLVVLGLLVVLLGRRGLRADDPLEQADSEPRPPVISPDGREVRHYQRVRLTNSHVVESGYLVILPAAYQESEAAWPLILFLHGSGESGDDLDRVAAEGLPRRAREVDLPFVIVAPQCPRDDDWTFSGQERRLDALLSMVMRRYRIDRQRIYLTGCSMGGFAVWNFAMAHPNRFAAIVPICGRGRTSGAKTIRQLPIWVFHGEQDEAISVKASRKMVKALRAVGSPVKYTEYADGGHDVWTQAYRTPELFEWLLEQRLPDSEVGPR